MRFRLAPITISSDIEKAFLQIALHKKDRDATRFLWVKNVNKEIYKENILELRFKRLAFGLTCSPFLLSACIHKHLDTNKTHISQEIKQNIYVDNIILAADTVEEAQEKCIVAKNLFNQFSMNLREFCSNNEKALHKR